MRQSITTKYLGPTDARGSRIKAIARKANKRNGWPEMSATTSYQYDGTEQEHAKAAKTCAEKYGWHGLWVGGGNMDENGNVYVNVADAYEGAPDSSMGREGADWFFVHRPSAKA